MSVPSNLIPTRVTQLPTAPAGATAADSQIIVIYNGVSYQVNAAQIVSTTGVPSTRQVNSGTGLDGGGDLSANRTISIATGGVDFDQLAVSGVTAGEYGSTTRIPVITVDEKGRVTSVDTAEIVVEGFVPTSREVLAGNGLTGGGALTDDVTLNANLSDAMPESAHQTGSAGTSLELSRSDHRHPAVDLSDDDEVNGTLGLSSGGTARSITPEAGAIVWSGADGLYVGPVGVAGQVLVSNGENEYGWGSALVIADQPANFVYAGPGGGVPGATGFRLLVNADVPTALTGKTLDDCVLGSSVPAAGAFTTVDATNIEVTNLKAKDGVTAGSIADGTGVVTLNSVVFPTADINGGTADNVVVGGTTPAEGNFTTVDATNLEVTNLKAKSGVSSATIDDDTGTMTVYGSVLSTTDINGGTADNVVLGGSVPAAGTFTSAEVESLQLDTNPPAQTDVAGLMYWNSDDQAKTMNLVMQGGGVVQQVGEELYFRVKASAAITDGQVVMYTGAVGASGGVLAAPAAGLGYNEGRHILGIATESIALNGWGYITNFGVVRGINTDNNGLSPSDPDYETWVAGDILYYDPAHAGRLTKNVPVAPNPKVMMALITYSSATMGTLTVQPFAFPFLGALSNVDTTPPAHDDLLQYNTDHWKNTPATSVTTGHATSLAGGAANRVAYQSAADTTAFTAAPTVAASVLQWSGSTYEWRNTAVANGLATLDSGGAVPTSQLPAAVLGAVKYQGTWNASTNTPTITSSSGTQGHYYVVDVAGSTVVDGIASWNVGDWIIFNGAVWQKIDNTDQVMSVNGYTGTVVLDYTDVGAPATDGTNATGTWSIDINGTAADVAHELTRGAYLTGSNFDGSAATTWAVDASSVATPSKVVVRDASGDFAGNVITATTYVGIDGGTF